MKCEICDRQFNGTNPLCVHLRRTHNMNAQTYYDKYFKIDDEGLCLTCEKPTLFNNLLDGYNLYCSRDCANHSQLRIDKIKQTTEEKYGVSCIFKRKDIRQKCEQAANSPEAREKAKQTCLEHYGADHPMHSDEVKDKMKQTCLDRYGTEYSFQSENNRQKSRETMLKKYGVDHSSKMTENKRKFVERTHTEEVNKKRHDTRKSTGWLKNKVEKYFISKLTIDFEHNYKSNVYPYHCDFYLPDYNLYIEINNYWAHGKHFYDETNQEDVDLMNKWKNHSDDLKDLYVQAACTWLKDIEKRDCAIKGNLNYVVLWNIEQIDKFFEDFDNKDFIGFIDYNELFT